MAADREFSGARFRSALLVVGAGILLGGWLRVRHVGAQVVAGDEWHAIRSAHDGFVSVVTHFGIADRSIPLTIYEWVLLRLGLLDEVTLRLPMLLAGLAVLALLPAHVWRHGGPVAACAAAWVLALQPVHVFYSRFSRPYALVFLSCAVAAVVFERWWRHPKRSMALAHLALAAASLWLFLGSAVVICAPFLVTAWDAARAGDAAGMRRLRRHATALAGVAAALLGPPLLRDHRALADKIADGALRPGTLWEALLVGAGTSSFVLALVAAGVTLVGAAAHARREPWLFRVGCVALLGTMILVVVTSPRGVVHGHVVVRYVFSAGAFLVCWFALGLARIAAKGAAGGVGAVLLLASLAATGPLARTPRVASWTNHPVFQHAADDLSRDQAVAAARTNRFYHQLSTLPAGSLTIVEVPFHVNWRFLLPYAGAQVVHRQWVVAGYDGAGGAPVATGLRARFRTVVDARDRDAVLRTGARYLTVHRGGEAGGGPMLDRRALSAVYEPACGPPEVAGADMLVFDLSRCR